MTNFTKIIEKYRQYSSSVANQGYKFERLMKNFLETYQLYKNLFENVWLWNDFPFKNQFGGHDVGIDIITKTKNNEYWAIQCKCFSENAYIQKADVDTFLSTSAKSFINEDNERINFSYRLWISTTDNWSKNAEESLKNQTPEVGKLSLTDLKEAEVDWEKLDNDFKSRQAELKKKEPREYQNKVIEATKKYFEEGNTRGKLIMACGTGKTFTSLKIAEMFAKEKLLKMFNPLSQYNDFKCLFLVPSIALIGQALREWATQAETTINPICICSDNEVSRQNVDEDVGPEELAFPASTDAKKIVKQFELIEKTRKEGEMTVVFSTYQSIDIISKAQKKLNEKYNNEYNFDLIICDEAHRTAKATQKNKEESDFTKVHNNDFLVADKRIYMTATPIIYDEKIKSKAIENNFVDFVYSMDDEEYYGKEIYKIGFGDAVRDNLLTDYKVIVLTVNEDVISNDLIEDVIEDVKENIKEEDGTEIKTIETDDIVKLIGCINALSKNLPYDEDMKITDPGFMKKAVAFSNTIRVSKQNTNILNSLQRKYYNKLSEEDKISTVKIEAHHIDGSMTAGTREKELSWLKEEKADDFCKILLNAKCLSEGVDVPSLDAIMFLSDKSSQVDIVQSVGRVMRKAEGKKYGYIIVPVVIPYGEKPEDYLDKGDKFKTVWKVLNALRSHDEDFDIMVNSLRFSTNNENKNKSKIGYHNIGKEDNKLEITEEQLEFNLEKFRKTRNIIMAKVVEKVGKTDYIEKWAGDVAEIAKANINRINNILKNDAKAKNEFDKFINKLHKEINPSIAENDAIEMLSQHLITQPVFETLFENYSFTKNNPVSKSMSKVIQLLEEQTTQEENEKLQKVYDSVKRKVSLVETAEDKQSIIKELYENFFAVAFKNVVDKLGIVYTPIEVVDFIIHSVNDVLKKEFGKSLTDKGVEIIDPFTGTGTFITRLLQSGLIKKEDLARKYKKEIFANEIVLLAYYIASINIENVYHSLLDENESYKSFEGVCLTDTFQLYEDTINENIINSSDNLLVGVENAENIVLENSERIKKQKKSPIKIIISNPPYSVGQKSANDNNQNQHYKKLEEKIKNTYVKYSKAQKSSMYDSYIKAFRWASDRIDTNTGGIIGFITNSGWIDSNSADGFRHCLEKDFSNIYIFDLKGAIRGKNGEAVKKEGQNIFDIMTGIAITILVKKPNNINNQEKAKIHYYDIGDYLKRKEKLEILKNYKSILNDNIEWQDIEPNEHNDWLNQRNELFNNYISIEPDKKYNTNTKSYFVNYSAGINTARDVWVYNFSKNELEKNINTTINYYNEQRIEVKENKKELIKDPKKSNWTRDWNKYLIRNEEIKEDKNSYYEGIYRPFCKENVYFNEYLNEERLQMPSIFPYRNIKNLCICVSGLGSEKNLSALIINKIIDSHLNGDTQCFPLYYYEKKDDIQTSLDIKNEEENDYIKHDGISDFILKRCQENYKTKDITKEDIFYYVYGFLHNENYRNKFQADLKKMLPRIPLVDNFEDFKKISDIGRQLADLHLNYETVPANKDCVVMGRESNDFCVKKMAFGKNGKDKDKSVVIYNSSIRIENIPQKAYEYIINSKSAVEWIMDRYQVSQDKNSGLTNDPNDWAKEHNKPSYILDLLLSVIEVSVRTVDLVGEVNKINVEFE